MMSVFKKRKKAPKPIKYLKLFGQDSPFDMERIDMQSYLLFKLIELHGKEFWDILMKDEYVILSEETYEFFNQHFYPTPKKQ
jgi:hypothetical protein